MADWYKVSLEKHHPATHQQEAAAAVKEEDDGLMFASRRSPVICRHAAVATSQPLASSLGLHWLRGEGANAAETAIVIAAALAVTEPCSTGLGGDMFALHYDSSTHQVTAINGSGKSPASLTFQKLQEAHPNRDNNNQGVCSPDFRDSALAVTVPGAAAGWEDLLQRHGSGKFTLQQLLEPAAALAEEGFPVAPVTSYHWKAGMNQITKWFSNDPLNETVSIPLSGPQNGQAPEPGDIVVNTDMARVLRDLGEHGAQRGFYQGQTGQAIVSALQKHGGCMSLEDLAAHRSDFPQPICAEYQGCKLWQVPPNGQGIAALIALTGLQHLEEEGTIPKLSSLSRDTIGGADWYHAMIEMMRLGFADNRTYVADAAHMQVNCDWLLDRQRIGKRAAALFDPNRAVIHGIPDASSCTVSFQVVDCQGNAISFVNSNFQGFGTGIAPQGCGFTLQNRGSGFTLEPRNHPNAVGPNKRPYHTIIPAILTHTDTGELYATLSNMGGNMQPQGHLQLTVDMLSGNLDPQVSIDMPRFCISDGTHNGVVFFEEGVDESVLNELRRRGHNLQAGIKGHERCIFGRAQIIKRDRATNVLWAGSDGRADGCAMGF